MAGRMAMTGARDFLGGDFFRQDGGALCGLRGLCGSCALGSMDGIDIRAVAAACTGHGDAEGDDAGGVTQVPAISVSVGFG
ncbi:protein of unknown function [Sterolibacterium denitrificans]|uniref:Uncharacterized protein n=1 Tax=Sterolibacterium denitrificans TaxID=157592 RepID=A0A7Z7HQT2_9PROT|nr:protein of unknown function [Sterolibacterium denitrificans]